MIRQLTTLIERDSHLLKSSYAFIGSTKLKI